jgi:hypothetical protein
VHDEAKRFCDCDYHHTCRLLSQSLLHEHVKTLERVKGARFRDHQVERFDVLLVEALQVKPPRTVVRSLSAL